METWTVAYTNPETEGTHYEYAYYGTFLEAKSVLLACLSKTGLDYLTNANIPNKTITKLGEATIDMLRLEEEDFDETHASLTYQDGFMIFVIQKGELNDENRSSDATFELLADHRKCTADFCFTELETNRN